jgi:predicted nucleic acid-binding protein
MKLLADTSIIIALIASDEEKSIINQIINDCELLCPASIHAEVGNAISAMFKRGRINLLQSLEMLDNFEQLEFKVINFNLRRAIEISYLHKVYAYDAYVLECAKSNQLPLITLDRQMQEKAKLLNIQIIEV